MSDYTPANWMHEKLSLLGNRTLMNICITGSHDSGMSVVQHGTAGANNCNCQTQSYDIAKQLELGARYFDIRPVIGSGDFYTGHYTKISSDELGISSMQGARGQSISDIITEINDFIEQNSELVVLNLSHDMDTDSGNSDYPPFTQSQYDQLLTELSNLKNLYVSGAGEAPNLLEKTLNDFIGDGKGAVIVVVKPENSSVSLGNFLGKGFYPYSSFNAYNSYADTNDLSKMISDQLGKMRTVKAESPPGYFLLSWTLTQSSGQAIACVFSFSGSTTILDLASEADGVLTETVSKNISPTVYPNIIYIDNITNSEFVGLAMTVNNQISSS